jgi:hypothetical protein
MAIDLHPDRDSWLSHPLLISACIVSVVLVTFVPVRHLLLRRWIDDAACIWDIGSSFFYLRQRHQLFRLPEHVFLDGLSDSPSIVALRGQTIWVHASWTPLRIPLAGMQVYLVALVDAAVFISSPWTLLYQSFPLETFLYYVWFNIYIYYVFVKKKRKRSTSIGV